MRILISFLYMAVFGTVLAWSQKPAKDYFVNMPDSLCPLLTAVNRADCIDFVESGMRAEVTNRLDGKTQMTSLTPTYVALQLTATSTWQMKLLPLNDSIQVICTVSTACAPACDSHLRFYTTQWEELPLHRFLPSLPEKEDFLLPAAESDDVYAYRDLVRQLDITLLKAVLSADSSELTFILDTPTYMEAEAGEKVKKYLRSTLDYHWINGKFVPAGVDVE